MTDPDANNEGLALEDLMPIQWQPADFRISSALEHANEDTARALQAIAVFEETPRSPTDDIVHVSADSSRLEAKIDLLLSLVSNFIGDKVGLPEPRPIILRGRSIEWQPEEGFPCERGVSGFANIWANSHIPLPLRLPCRLDGHIERNGFKWCRAAIEFLAPNVRDGLEQVIFRHHRRQVAIARGTMLPAGFESTK